MKKVLISALCLLPLGLLAQKPFVVKGKVGELNAPARAIITYRVGNVNMVDSATLKKGVFEFKGEVTQPTQAVISVKHDASPLETDPAKRKPLDAIAVYLDKGEIILKAKDSLRYAEVTGAKINLDNERYKKLFKAIDEEVAVLMKEYNGYTKAQQQDEKFMEPFMERYNKANEPRAAINRQFAAENPDSYIGFLAFRNYMGYDFDPAVVEPEFHKFSAEIRESADGKRVQTMIDGAKKTSIGVVTDFTQNDPDGNPVKLSDFRGKYVLVDFWASWCGPCRVENPNLVDAYQKFKDKNFTILGVSLDRPGAKEAWLKAIKDDNLTWTQVSDLKFWDNEVSKSYGISAIPFSFLVDPTGKIIAKNLRGKALHQKLEEILGAPSK